ncbi:MULTISPECIES: TIGR04222 domain-containing membrane protein [unclassified Streptomyces]|uniref:TIGR04222 domain-containing membrane protein n=1 Tax=unclassified Streptomyces TaxID=2593676 RepID=UPI0033AE4A23
MSGSAAVGPGPQTVALLRGGPRAAVQVAVLALHLRGAVAAGPPGTIRTSGPSSGTSFTSGLALERAVRGSLYLPAGLRELMQRPRVRRALAELRSEAAAAGLLRPLPPHRTRAARRTLRELRAAFPPPTGPRGLSTDEVLLAVALYGDSALTELVPGFTEAAGLTGRGGRQEERGLPWSGGGEGGGFSGCAGGWGA